MSKYSNFIILYNAREGSSAIVSMLSAQKSVHVPLFEDLDRRMASTENDLTDLPAVINRIFQTGRLEGVKRHFSLYPSQWQVGDSIGFKMRLQERNDALPAVLKDNNVKLFVLSRRDYMELLCSNYVNVHRAASQGEGGKLFPQFDIAAMSEKDRELALTEIDNFRIKVQFDDMATMAGKIYNTRRRLVNFATKLSRQGIEIIPIYYEDFVDNRIEFIRSMLTSLGFPPDWPIVDQTKLVKVMKSPAQNKLHGLVWQLARMRVQIERFRYWRQLRRLEKLRTPS